MKKASSPRCPKCRYVMCEQFDYKPVGNLASVGFPNGNYVCYHCGTKSKPPAEVSKIKVVP